MSYPFLFAAASLLLSLSLQPRPAECFLEDLFRDVGEGIFDAFIGIKRAIGLNDLADDLEENIRGNNGKKKK